MQGTSEGEGHQQAGPPSTGRLGVLLAAGNQGMLAFADALHLLFMENMATIVKHNPVRVYNHEYMCTLFAPLIREGYFASVVGGVEESQRLVYDPKVDHVHMTGGKATHDAIVWGGKQRTNNLLGKPITSELGAVTPYVVGPGAWTDSEIDHHARYFATVLANNNGCNCNAPQVLLLPGSGFPREEFLSAVKAILKSRPHAPPYYPGTAARHQAWIDGLDPTELVSSEVQLPPGRFGPPLPWALSEVACERITAGEADVAARVEAFGPTLAIVTLPGEEGSGFWHRAAELCNDHLEGSLSCTLVAHPSEAPNEAEIEAFRYGSVGINSWGGQSFGFGSATWGAYPGETIEDVASGVGVVRNFLFLKNVEKTVVHAPFISAARGQSRSRHGPRIAPLAAPLPGPCVDPACTLRAPCVHPAYTLRTPSPGPCVHTLLDPTCTLPTDQRLPSLSDRRTLARHPSPWTCRLPRCSARSSRTTCTPHSTTSPTATCKATFWPSPRRGCIRSCRSRVPSPRTSPAATCATASTSALRRWVGCTCSTVTQCCTPSCLGTASAPHMQTRGSARRASSPTTPQVAIATRRLAT